MIADATGAVLGRRLMGIEAAARYIDATPRTIERLIARGVLTRVHIPTLRRVLVALEDLDRLIDAAKVMESVRIAEGAHNVAGAAEKCRSDKP
jgi:hypothetical protein